MTDIIFNVGLIHYLFLSLFLFMTGLIGVLISRNMLRAVMSLFIMTISVVLNCVAFGYYCDGTMEKVNMLSIFILILAVIQTVIALVILYKIYQANEYLDTEKIKDKEN